MFFTALIVIGAVLFTYNQPRYYEVQMTAFVLPSEDNISKSQNAFPKEYYEKISRSPKILNGVLESLPDEVKFGDNISPLDYLSSMLRVKSKIVTATQGITSSALILTYYVRHTDPFSAYQIANTWQKVLEDKIAQSEKDTITSKYRKKEEQLKLGKVNWDKAKKRLVDFREGYSIKNKLVELNSIRRLTLGVYRDYEVLVQPREINKYKALILALEENYQAAKETLIADKDLLKLQSQIIDLPEIHINNLENNISNLSKPVNNEGLGQIYVRLQEKIINGELFLKTLFLQKVRLEKRVRSLELDLGNQNQVSESAEFAEKKNQMKSYGNIIKQGPLILSPIWHRACCV